MVGSAKVRIDVCGCIDCGTEHSSGWSPAEKINVSVGGRRPITVFVDRCADCVAKRKSQVSVTK